MKYSEFTSKLSQNVDTVTSIHESDKHQDQIARIYDKLVEDVYSDKIKIASIIKEEHGIKVSTNIVEEYINLAKSKKFSIDSALFHIREMNHYDNTIDNKIQYILNDNTTIAIDIETQESLNKILENKSNVVEFMQESSDNFLRILKTIKEF